jgi:hypothetical protein
VPTPAVRYEKQLVGLRRVEHGGQGRAARIADRRRRHAINPVGIVGCLGDQFGLADPAAQWSAPRDTIDDGRVALQPDTPGEAVEKHRRNARALRRQASLLLDD